MDVFTLRNAAVDQYAGYVSSSLKVADERLRGWLQEQLGKGIFWPRTSPPTQPKLRIWLLPSGFGG